MTIVTKRTSLLSLVLLQPFFTFKMPYLNFYIFKLYDYQLKLWTSLFLCTSRKYINLKCLQQITKRQLFVQKEFISSFLLSGVNANIAYIFCSQHCKHLKPCNFTRGSPCLQIQGGCLDSQFYAQYKKDNDNCFYSILNLETKLMFWDISSWFNSGGPYVPPWAG